MKKVKKLEKVPKNIYTKTCKYSKCPRITFECDHDNREFCCERCKRNYERDQKKKKREEIKRSEFQLKHAISVFEEHLNAGKNKITKAEMKNRNINETCFIAKVKSLKGEFIYAYENFLLHKISENEYQITKI